jgi:hypothetical protein
MHVFNLTSIYSAVTKSPSDNVHTPYTMAYFFMITCTREPNICVGSKLYCGPHRIYCPPQKIQGFEYDSINSYNMPASMLGHTVYVHLHFNYNTQRRVGQKTFPQPCGSIMERQEELCPNNQKHLIGGDLPEHKHDRNTYWVVYRHTLGRSRGKEISASCPRRSTSHCPKIYDSLWARLRLDSPLLKL